MMTTEQLTKEEIMAEIQTEITENKIIFYGKGTKDVPMCGFTMETVQFLSQFNKPFEVINVLDNPAKRQVLSEMTNWPTLPKVFINGKFYGDTDILGPMHEKGEVAALIKEAFGE